MRPILLKGHERSITFVTFNQEGDLLFSASKGAQPNLWRADTGERLGTYNGHNGAVWSISVDRKSEKLISGSADNTIKIWDVETGKLLNDLTEERPIRSVCWSNSGRQFFGITDAVMGREANIKIYYDPNNHKNVRTIKLTGVAQGVKILQGLWSSLDTEIYAACDDGFIRVWNTESGDLVKQVGDHKKAVNGLSWSKDKTFFVSASDDFTAKVFDARTCQCLKTFETDKPVNAAAISPYMHHVIVGGGQEADAVTTTHGKAGQFQVRFFHEIFENELGSIKGHFGPINALAWAPDGQTFASGGEDGYVRLHHMDESYFKTFRTDIRDPHLR
eukprot:TRINITY_DN1248_c0_g1_i2.p1 TRINITY_DN1248_c0_g1~~TRINITY_DN1248_c0_g1_i2.p1  ORF type:complete len:349 (-),score=79.69 TRINITY_DN1248_c0_g1_i2:107-1102(-)